MTSIINAANRYSEAHQLLLQLLMEHGQIRANNIIDVFTEICLKTIGDVEVPPDFTDQTLSSLLMKKINNKMKTCKMNARVAIVDSWHLADEKYLTLYHNSAAADKVNVFLTPTEKQLIEKWQIMMFCEDNSNGELDSVGAYVAGKDLGIGPLKVEKFFKKLCLQNIFYKLRNFDSYILTSKAFMEMDARFRTRGYNFRECELCKSLIVMLRFRDQCKKCSTAFHMSCMDKMVKRSNGKGVNCPGKDENDKRCDYRWTEKDIENYVFDEAAPEEIDHPTVIVGNDSQNINGFNNDFMEDDRDENKMLDNDDEETYMFAPRPPKSLDDISAIDAVDSDHDNNIGAMVSQSGFCLSDEENTNHVARSSWDDDTAGSSHVNDI